MFTGEIRLRKPIDREMSGNWLNITVVVQDAATESRTSSIDIPVHVKDLNDNSPM